MMNLNYKRKLADEDDGKEQIITFSAAGLGNNNTPVGNKIYLYDDITRDSILSVSKQIDEVTRQLKLLQLFYNLKDSPVIELHISSDGGEVSPALSLVDKIKTNELPIHTYIEGMVASAATLISVVGKKRFITPNSNILIHSVSGGIAGKIDAIEDEHQNLQLFMVVVKDIYLKHSKFKAKQLNDLLKHDLCLTAQQALDYGVVDIII